MRAYSASDEEALRARDLLKDWAGEGLLNDAQYQRMASETVCELRRTNIFLRLVLFFFTLLIVGAATGLFFAVFFSRPAREIMGVFLLIFAGLCYAAAELAVSRGRLYRYGIEEALAACAVGFLCGGMQSAFFGAGFLVPSAGAIASLWIWHRFGLPYTFPIAMIFAAFVPGHWTASRSVEHVGIAALYAFGLLTVTAAGDLHRSGYLNKMFSSAEAFLWVGIYLAINVQFSSLYSLGKWWTGAPQGISEFPTLFYWSTWVLMWCLPLLVLARGVRRRDRFVLWSGALLTVLTLITNKPYLGWPRHTWDPMLLGALLIGVALASRRWLAGGPGESRHGFTGQRLAGKDQAWMSAGATVFGLVSPNIIAAGMPAPENPGVHFGGGDAGGGGASSDY